MNYPMDFDKWIKLRSTKKKMRLIMQDLAGQLEIDYNIFNALPPKNPANSNSIIQKPY